MPRGTNTQVRAEGVCRVQVSPGEPVGLESLAEAVERLSRPDFIPQL